LVLKKKRKKRSYFKKTQKRVASAIQREKREREAEKSRNSQKVCEMGGDRTLAGERPFLPHAKIPVFFKR